MLRFLELGSLLEAGKPSKVDKAAILTDAVRMVTQLRSETMKLKQSNEDLQEKIKELKVRFCYFFSSKLMILCHFVFWGWFYMRRKC